MKEAPRKNLIRVGKSPKKSNWREGSEFGIFFIPTKEPISMSSEEEAEPSLENPSEDRDPARGKGRRHHNTLRDILDDFASDEDAGGVPITPKS